MSDLARLTFSREGDAVVARLEGDVDSTNVAEIAAALTDGLDSAGSGLALDLEPTRYLDSAGIQMLIRVNEDLGSRGQGIALAVPEDSPLSSVLDIAGVGQLLTVAPDVDAALETLRR